MNLIFMSSKIFSPLLLMILISNLAAEDATSYSISLNMGMYHSMRDLPSTPQPLPEHEKYDLNNGFGLTINVFKKSLLGMNQRHRIGLMYGYFRLTGDPLVKNEERWNKTDRTYEMQNLWGIIQIRLTEATSPLILVDISGGISIMTYQDADGTTPVCESFICLPTINLGLRAGLAGVFYIHKNIGIKVGSRIHLQPGKGEIAYPYSKGLFFDLGLLLDFR